MCVYNICEYFTILFVFNISEIDIDTHKLLFEDVREMKWNWYNVTKESLS